MTRSRHAVTLVVGVGMLLAGACAGTDGDSKSVETTTEQTIGSTAGALGASAADASDTDTGAGEATDATLTIGVASDVAGLDPQSVPGTGGGNYAAYIPIFGGDNSAMLVVADPETSEWLPGIAESWQMSDDGMTWTFDVRTDVRFHNGEELTSEDVKFSFDRTIGQAEYNPDFQSGQRGTYEPIVESVEAPDPSTVIVHMKAPDVTLPIKPLYIVPKDYIEEVGDEGFANAPVGAGPFKFVSWTPGDEIVLERYDGYFLGWDSSTGFHPPYVKTLTQKVIPDDAARLAALQAGEIDMAHSMSADIAKQMDGQDGFKVWYMPGTQPMYFSLNTADETAPDGSPNPWRDARVREAVNWAVDLDTIIETILTGQERPTFGSSSTGFGFPEGIESERFRFDPDRARELLAEAGYPDGFSTTMAGPIGRWPNSRSVMEAAAEYLSEVGIEVDIREMQYQEYVTRIQDRDLPGMAFFGCSWGSDPATNFRYCYHSSGSFANGTTIDSAGERDLVERMDALVEESELTFDRDERSQLLETIIREFYLNPRALWLYEPVTVLIGTDDWQWDFRARDLQAPEYFNIAPAS